MLESIDQAYGITFSGEAYESFQRFVEFLGEYTVEVTASAESERFAGETFDAQVIGPDHDSDWGDSVRLFPVDENGERLDDGIPFTVRATRIHVY